MQLHRLLLLAMACGAHGFVPALNPLPAMKVAVMPHALSFPNTSPSRYFQPARISSGTRCAKNATLSKACLVLTTMPPH